MYCWCWSCTTTHTSTYLICILHTIYMNLHDWCQVLLVYVELQSSISRSPCIIKLMIIRLVVSRLNHANFIPDALKDVDVWTSFWKLVVLLTTGWLNKSSLIVYVLSSRKCLTYPPGPLFRKAYFQGLQGGPLQVINGVKTSINGLLNLI